jgi:hypothetical protein
MRDEARKTQHETELAGQAMQHGEMRERGAMPMEEQGPEVAGHAQTMAQQPAESGATAEKGRQAGTEAQTQQRGAPAPPEQGI